VGGSPDSTNDPPEFDDEPFEWEFVNNMKRFCLNRHDGYINGVFMDFSVRKIGLKELWLLKWHRKFDNTTGPWSYHVKTTSWPKWMRDFKNYAR
jgi:hypothetical protein